MLHSLQLESMHSKIAPIWVVYIIMSQNHLNTAEPHSQASTQQRPWFWMLTPATCSAAWACLGEPPSVAASPGRRRLSRRRPHPDRAHRNHHLFVRRVLLHRRAYCFPMLLHLREAPKASVAVLDERIAFPFDSILLASVGDNTHQILGKEEFKKIRVWSHNHWFHHFRKFLDVLQIVIFWFAVFRNSLVYRKHSYNHWNNSQLWETFR